MDQLIRGILAQGWGIELTSTAPLLPMHKKNIGSGINPQVL